MEKLITKKIYLLLFTLLCIPALLHSTPNITPINGSVNVCEGEVVTYTYPYSNGNNYIWSVNGGTGISTINSSLNLATFTVTWGLSGTPPYTVNLQEYNGPNLVNSETLNITVNLNPNPQISSNFDSDCVDDTIKGERNFNPDDRRGPSECETVCEYSPVTYTTDLTSGNTYQWTVIGDYTGISGATTNSATVDWGAPGQAYVIVTETTPAGCTQTDTTCIEIVEKPDAEFKVDQGNSAINSSPNQGSANTIEICKDGTICFDDLSVGGSSWFWDFGNGNTSTQQSPCETFTTPGSYLVTQIVENECHCTDTAYMWVEVNQEEGAEIVCQNTVCGSGTFVYDAILPTPCSGGYYEWTISNNGTIINANGTIGTMLPQYVDGTDVTSIEVDWNSGPIGTIGLSISGCGGVCDKITTVDIPIIPNTLDIEGDEIVCIGETGNFEVPCFPGTTYRWYIDGVVQSSSTHEFSYQFNSLGTHQIEVSYQNSFLGCSGSSNTFFVEVLNPFSIDGPESVCEGDAITIQAPSGAFNWTVKDQNGTIHQTASSTTSLLTSNSLPAGTYTVIAEEVASPGSYCNEYAVHGFTVIEQPPAPSGINGPVEVCIGEVSVYTASPSSNNYYLEWEVFNNGTTTVSNGNSVTVNWSTGTKWIALYHVSKQDDCKSIGDTTYIIDKTPPPITITGPDTVCGNTNALSPEIYSTTATLDDYEWSVSPATAGSVVDGQGTNSIEVIWNNYSGFADVVLTPIVCNTSHTPINYQVYVTTPIMSLNGPDTVCQNTWNNWNASFNIGSGSNYSWEIESINTGNIIANGTGSTASYNFPSNSGSFIIRMTAENCMLQHTITKNIVVNPEPVANLTYSGQIGCIDQYTATLYLSMQSSSYSYVWYHGSNPITPQPTTSLTIGNNSADAGNYYVVITDNISGCTSTTNTLRARVCSTPNPCTPNGGNASFTYSIAQTSPSPGCNTVTFNETISPTPNSIRWYFGNVGTSTASNPTFQFPASGIYPVTLVADYGSGICKVADTQTVVVPVMSDFEINISCIGNTFEVNLINTSDVVIEPLANYNHQWEIYDVTGSPTLITSATTQDYLAVPGLIEGNDYEIYLEESHTFNWGGQTINALCEHVVNFTMPEKADANFTISSPMLPTCEGNTVVFTDQSIGDISSWSWDFDDGSNILTQHPEKTYDYGQVFDVELSIVDEYGCTDSYTVPVEIKDNNIDGNITVSPNMPICPGTTATIAFNNTTSPSSAPYNYYWSDNTTSISTTSTQTSTHYLAVTDTYGCFKSFGPATVEVVEVPLAKITGEDEYCIGDDIGLICNYGNGYTYTWYQNISGGGYVSAGVTGTSFNLSNAPVGTHEFKVELEDINHNCVKESLPFTVIVHPNPPTPILSSVPVPACPSPVTLTVNNPSDYNSISWSSGDVSTSTTVNNSGVYYAVGTDTNGCSSYNSINVYELPDFCSFMCGCYSDCIEQGGSYSFPGISGNFAQWRWERFDGVNWNTVSSGTGAVPDYVTSSTGTHTIRLYVMTYNGCDGYSCEVDLNLTHCGERCEGEAQMNDIKCYVKDDGLVNYRFNMDINFGGFGKKCDKYSYTIIPPVGSVPQSSLNPNTLTPGYNNIEGVWQTNQTYYPGGKVCFEIVIQNLCDSTICTMEVCFEVEECGKPCEGEAQMNDVKCYKTDDGFANYRFNMDIGFGGFGKKCDKYSYTIIPPIGSVPQSSLNPNTITPGYNNIEGIWQTNQTYYPGGKVCFEIVIQNLCDSSTCRMRVCFEVDECGDPDASSRIKSLQDKQETTPKEIRFYPNPTTGMLQIESPNEGVYDVAVYDINGKLVFNDKINFSSSGVKRVNLDYLNAGIYSIQCIGDNKIETKQLIISK